MNTNRHHKIINALGEVRAQIESEFTSLREAQPHVLQLAINEAEAIAMETEFPQLLFPALATEKAAALERWHRRQSVIRRSEPSLAFAA